VSGLELELSLRVRRAHTTGLDVALNWELVLESGRKTCCIWLWRQLDVVDEEVAAL
jgi:hypothetical protein